MLSVFFEKKFKYPTHSTFFATFPMLLFCSYLTSFWTHRDPKLFFPCWILMDQPIPTFTFFPISQHRFIIPWIVTSTSLSYLYPFCPQEALACTHLKQKSINLREKSHMLESWGNCIFMVASINWPDLATLLGNSVSLEVRVFQILPDSLLL